MHSMVLKSGKFTAYLISEGPFGDEGLETQIHTAGIAQWRGFGRETGRQKPGCAGQSKCHKPFRETHPMLSKYPEGSK